MATIFVDDQNVLTSSFLDRDEKSTSDTSYTFSGFSFGAADSNRYLIAGLTWQGSGVSISSVTIGGVSATQIGSTVTDGASRKVAVFYALVPTGTSGSIVVNFSGGSAANGSAVLYLLDGVGELIADNTTSTAGDPQATVDIAEGGAVIAVATAGAGSSPSASWTGSGMSEDTDQNFGTSNLQCRSSASGNYASAQSSLTIKCNFSVSAASCGAFVVFTP